MFRKVLFNGGAVCGLVWHISTVRFMMRLRRRRSVAFDWPSLRVYGISAGAAAALLWMCDVPPANYKSLFYSLIAESQTAARYGDHSSITRIQLAMLDYVRSHSHDRLVRIVRSRRLYVGISSARDGFVFSNGYTTVDELLHLVMCSATIPLVCTYHGLLRGASVCDGGVLFNSRARLAHRLHEADTLVVEPPIPLPLSLVVPAPLVFDWIGRWAELRVDTDVSTSLRARPGRDHRGDRKTKRRPFAPRAKVA